jgi:hypothetical protein
MKDRPRFHLVAATLLIGLLVLASGITTFAQTPLALTPPGSVKQYSWDPSVGGGSPKWTNGDNPGYWEGETAVMAAEITKEQGNTYELPICLQVWETSSGAYAFTGFEPFNTTTRSPNLPPPALPGGESINYGFPAPWDTGDPLIYGYNITINSVTSPVVGAPNCDPNEIGVVVNYTPQTNTGAYIVWGGHVAKAGDLLPAGAPDATVPVGKSAQYTTGNFQARIRTAAADKTLPFKVYAPTAVTLQSFAASVSQGTPYGFALAAMVGLVVVGSVHRRRMRR